MDSSGLQGSGPKKRGAQGLKGTDREDQLKSG